MAVKKMAPTAKLRQLVDLIAHLDALNAALRGLQSCDRELALDELRGVLARHSAAGPSSGPSATTPGARMKAFYRDW